MLALANPRRSFSGEFALALDDFLRREVGGVFHDREWAVVAHSGGGLLWYRWLVNHAPTFSGDYVSLPLCVVAIAAPYQNHLGRLDLPNGRRIAVKEPSLDPRTISLALPGRLTVVAAANDQTILGSDALFPPDIVEQEMVVQHVIPATGHRDVCHHLVVRRLLRHYLS